MSSFPAVLQVILFKHKLPSYSAAATRCTAVRSELAAAVSPYVTSLVMRYDLVPRFSAAHVGALQRELLAIDYKGLLHDDLMEHEVSRVLLSPLSAVSAVV